MTVINESGLYSLILSSKLDSARRFKRWVTSEVLPAIRKNGRYELEQQNRVLESRNALLKEITVQQKPLTDYARNILSSTQTVTITQITQDYGYSAIRFNELLMRLRIQHKVGGGKKLMKENAEFARLSESRVSSMICGARFYFSARLSRIRNVMRRRVHGKVLRTCWNSCPTHSLGRKPAVFVSGWASVGAVRR